jgi:hypothetical protein
MWYSIKSMAWRAAVSRIAASHRASKANIDKKSYYGCLKCHTRGALECRSVASAWRGKRILLREIGNIIEDA